MSKGILIGLPGTKALGGYSQRRRYIFEQHATVPEVV
jgi:hypothetical protein